MATPANTIKLRLAAHDGVRVRGIRASARPSPHIPKLVRDRAKDLLHELEEASEAACLWIGVQSGLTRTFGAGATLRKLGSR
jgi:hypothetical protein